MTQLDARYTRLGNDLEIGLKVYNIGWGGLESSPVDSSADPSQVNCPLGFFRVPTDAAEKAAKGYLKYRCISQREIAIFDAMISRDSARSIQSAAVLYASPPRYRYPDCQGFPWSGNIFKWGCVPRDDAEDDFEDYVNFLADRYSGRDTGKGKLSHFIVWNEAASGGWFDYSPVVPHGRLPTDPEIQGWLDKYARMMRRSHRAIARHLQGVAMYASIDPLWTTNSTMDADGTPHIGSRRVIQGLWQRLGTSIDWSVAAHPYGDDPAANTGPNWMNFAGLPKLVAFQETELRNRGFSKPLTKAQAYVFASEQGWQKRLGIDIQARNICRAHNIVAGIPNVLGTTHNYFQSRPVENDPINASFGLLPVSAGPTLEKADGIATWEAYKATRLSSWRKSPDHYCCQKHGLGCGQDRTPIGSLEGQAGNTAVIAGWALDPDTPKQSINVHLYFDGGPGACGAGCLRVAILAGVPRPDVNKSQGVTGNHGFTYTIPEKFRDGKPHTVRAYGINTGKGGNPELSGSFKSFTLKPPASAATRVTAVLAWLAEKVGVDTSRWSVAGGKRDYGDLSAAFRAAKDKDGKAGGGAFMGGKGGGTGGSGTGSLAFVKSTSDDLAATHTGMVDDYDRDAEKRIECSDMVAQCEKARQPALRRMRALANDLADLREQMPLACKNSCRCDLCNILEKKILDICEDELKSVVARVQQPCDLPSFCAALSIAVPGGAALTPKTDMCEMQVGQCGCGKSRCGNLCE